MLYIIKPHLVASVIKSANNTVLSTKYEIMSYLFFRSSFKDKGSNVYEYDNK